MAKSAKSYENELKRMIRERTKAECEAWLRPQIRATAMNMVILDRLQDKLETEEVTSSMTGSMGQQKIDVHPLLDKYDKMQNTLIKQFEKLGLTASNKDSGGNADADDEDPVLAVLSKR